MIGVVGISNDFLLDKIIKSRSCYMFSVLFIIILLFITIGILAASYWPTKHMNMLRARLTLYSILPCLIGVTFFITVVTKAYISILVIGVLFTAFMLIKPRLKEKIIKNENRGITTFERNGSESESWLFEDQNRTWSRMTNSQKEIWRKEFDRVKIPFPKTWMFFSCVISGWIIGILVRLSDGLNLL